MTYLSIQTGSKNRSRKRLKSFKLKLIKRIYMANMY